MNSKAGQLTSPFFYLREQINLSAGQIKVCLDAKHWDLSRYAFTRCIALLCAKLSPSSTRGTPIWLLSSLSLWPLAHWNCHHRRCHSRRCCFSPPCLFPHTSKIHCPCLMFIWVSKGCGIRHQFWLYRDGLWCWFHVRGCIWFWFYWFWGIWIWQ